MLTLQNAEHDVDRIQRDRKRLTGDSESCRGELDAVAQRRERTKEEMATARQDETAAQDAIAACERDVEAARAHVAEMEQRRDAQQRDLRELQGDIDAAQQLSAHETERMAPPGAGAQPHPRGPEPAQRPAVEHLRAQLRRGGGSPQGL